MFERKMLAGWGDMDFNGHMRNTAYLDRSADLRMMFFAEQGFPMKEFARLRIGPVVKRDEIEYFREIHLMEEFSVRLLLASLSEDGAKMIVRNEFFRGDQLAARVNSMVGWLDLEKRKLTAPPEVLRRAIEAMPRSED